MNDFQALLVFVTAVIGITAILLIILQSNVTSMIEKNNKAGMKKTKVKKSVEDMQRSGINLIKEELIKRDYEKHVVSQRCQHERSFVVYDTVTGEEFNYYEKKR